MTGDAEVILATERLVLRRLRVDEAAAVAEYKNDPEAARYLDVVRERPLVQRCEHQLADLDLMAYGCSALPVNP